MQPVYINIHFGPSNMASAVISSDDTPPLGLNKTHTLKKKSVLVSLTPEIGTPARELDFWGEHRDTGSEFSYTTTRCHV